MSSAHHPQSDPGDNAGNGFDDWINDVDWFNLESAHLVSLHSTMSSIAHA